MEISSKENQNNLRAELASIRRDAGILAEAWMVLWKAEELHTLDISNVVIRVCNCKVWLSGQVADRHQVALIESLVKAISQVRAVHNKLYVDSNRNVSKIDCK